ncbi:MAG: HDOD domain-containing protein, partial [Miltoncostaeaceae bacterium]
PVTGRRVGAVSPALVAGAAERLAAPSAVVEGALRTLSDDRTSLRHVAERVGQSPELAAQVMRLGSSAVFGGAADSIERAVVRLGADSLRGLLLAASTYPLLSGALPAYGTRAMALVHRAADVSEAAGAVADRLAPTEGPQARVAGLLHDIGMPILQQVVRDAGLHVSEPLRGLPAERSLFGTDHVRVGAWIAHRWGLAPALASAVQHHHADEAPEGDTPRAVWLAVLIVDARAGDMTAVERVGTAAAACGLPEATLEAFLLGADPDAGSGSPPDLTDREFEIMRMLAEGLAPKQVALQLGCSPSTVHNHLHHVYRKIGVSGQAHALLLARERGWV